MSVGEAVLLLVAGVGGGLAGSMAGLASLVSYPALLAVGLPPVAANVTNTIALVFSSIGSVSGSRPELVGLRPSLLRLSAAAVVGGAAGGALLLLTPASTFELLVPILIGAASIVIVLRPRPRAVAVEHRHSLTTTLGTGAVCVYAGYFGAAAGVVLLALLLRSTGDTLARSNAMKNVVLGMANAVAAVGFAVFGPVAWWYVVPTAIGFLVGGRLGPLVVRRAPERPLRLAIGVAGLVLAAALAVDTYR